MAKPPINDNEPGNTPARPTLANMERNLREWKAEVRKRISRMVAETIDHNRAPDAKALRRLGPDGRAAFHRTLVTAMNSDIAAKATRPRARQAAALLRPEGRDGPLLQAQPDWSARRKPRPSYVVRAWRAGLLRALLLILAAMALFHAPSGPTRLLLSVPQLLKALP
ncbi:hypothetical protein [Aureimonas ureilytica]|nr:hypothetical protein [Aureimonas ureilytica]